MVTIPYKETVIPYLDEVDNRAQKIGAVNTVVNRNGRLCGYNTDFYGFRYLLQKNGIDVADKKALVLGKAARPRLSLPFWRNWVHPKLSPYIIRNIRKPSPMQNVIKIMPMQKSS